MEPRKSTSTLKKSTALPPDLSDLISKVFREAYEAESQTHEIVVDGKIFTEEIVVTVGFYPLGGIRPRNFEASVDYVVGQENATDRVHFCIDAIDAMARQYFEAAGDIEMPSNWCEFTLDADQKIYLKTSTENLRLEKMAADLLGENFDSESEEIEAAIDALFSKNPNDINKH